MKRSRDDLHPAPDISKYRRVAPKPEDYETADAYTMRQPVPPAAPFGVLTPGRYACAPPRLLHHHQARARCPFASVGSLLLLLLAHALPSVPLCPLACALCACARVPSTASSTHRSRRRPASP